MKNSFHDSDRNIELSELNEQSKAMLKKAFADALGDIPDSIQKEVKEKIGSSLLNFKNEMQGIVKPESRKIAQKVENVEKEVIKEITEKHYEIKKLLESCKEDLMAIDKNIDSYISNLENTFNDSLVAQSKEIKDDIKNGIERIEFAKKFIDSKISDLEKRFIDLLTTQLQKIKNKTKNDIESLALYVDKRFRILILMVGVNIVILLLNLLLILFKK